MKRIAQSLALVSVLATLLFASTVPQGKKTVSSAGTPVQLTTVSQPANGLLFQALTANTGNIYIGTSTLNKSTGAGVIYVLGPGAGISLGGKATVASEDPSLIWLDSDVSGEGLLWSIQQ